MRLELPYTQARPSCIGGDDERVVEESWETFPSGELAESTTMASLDRLARHPLYGVNLAIVQILRAPTVEHACER